MAASILGEKCVFFIDLFSEKPHFSIGLLANVKILKSLEQKFENFGYRRSLTFYRGTILVGKHLEFGRKMRIFLRSFRWETSFLDGSFYLLWKL